LSVFWECGIKFHRNSPKEQNALKLKLSLSIFFIFFALLISCTHAPAPPPSTTKAEKIPPLSRTKKKQPPYMVDGKIYYPLGEVKDYKEQGIASWYGPDFHGKKTSNGEQYDMYASTAAHRILPFGTKVQITNLENGKKTVVVINDRGPFAKDRILDLSYCGAKEIGLIGPGTARVELEVVGVTEGTQLDWKGVFTVQLGAFKERTNALRLKEKISLINPSAHISVYETLEGAVFYQVRVGKYNNLEETIQAQREFEARGFQDTFIVAE
jgi:rare lipoprotein A